MTRSGSTTQPIDSNYRKNLFYEVTITPSGGLSGFNFSDTFSLASLNVSTTPSDTDHASPLDVTDPSNQGVAATLGTAFTDTLPQGSVLTAATADVTPVPPENVVRCDRH